ncbi:type II toxin-antitoxin system VapC family toxin [Tepidicaulis sp. LMO-SS28]|uniref:type II toxin-antitoxin system VapC family toxin n=1 Tax=Tepidicaulis sp. LMO-SS28 TaxID=3447455 RepID=UPI003EE0D5AF
MKITADTNLLVRGAVRDDESQARTAARILKSADIIAVAIPTLCEFVWVLRKVYGFSSGEVAAALRALLDTANLAVNRPAAEAGLAMLEAGGDFADGAIAYEGRQLGGETFVSFDRQAAELLEAHGFPVKLLKE